MRQVSGNGGGRFFERRETVGRAVHESDHFVRASHFDTSGDVYEHECSQSWRRRGGDHHADQSAERRADDDGFVVELFDDTTNIAGEGVERVFAIGRPLAVAVASQVE